MALYRLGGHAPTWRSGGLAASASGCVERAALFRTELERVGRVPTSCNFPEQRNG